MLDIWARLGGGRAVARMAALLPSFALDLEPGTRAVLNRVDSCFPVDDSTSLGGLKEKVLSILLQHELYTT